MQFSQLTIVLLSIASTAFARIRAGSCDRGAGRSGTGRFGTCHIPGDGQGYEGFDVDCSQNSPCISDKHSGVPLRCNLIGNSLEALCYNQ
ncbi:unnamed protein product [Zymoseptoria tritici ST99CH_3D1]|nr:unnamed protein product [Zymoseptoria tritici ST99CH_3D1]